MGNTSAFNDNMLVPYTTFKSVGITATQFQSLASTVGARCWQFTVESNSANTGVVFVGMVGINSTLCLHLGPGDAFTGPAMYSGTCLKQYDLTAWYLRASAASQKVTITRTIDGRQVS